MRASSTSASRTTWLPLAPAMAIYLVALVATGRGLPERVASHFGISGAADNWMDRTTYLVFLAVWGLGLPCLFLSVGWMIRHLPAAVINLPRRDYWLAPERREETIADIERRMVWLSCLLLVFCLGVHLLVVDANQSQPIRLSNLIWVWMAAFLTTMLIWVIRLWRRFAAVPTD